MEAPAASNTTRTVDPALEKKLEQQIVLGTWGRIHDLRVELTEGRVVVRGRTPSYYVKQLVLQAVVDVLGPTAPPVQYDIQVGTGDSHSLPGNDDLWGVPRLPLKAAARAGSDKGTHVS